MTSNGIRLFVFGIICVVGVYAFSCLYYRRLQKIDITVALLYVTAVAMIGVLGEIFVDTIYAKVFGTPLWRYNFLPIHNGYTSQFSPVLWGSFGLFLYLMHHNYEKWTRSQLIRLSLIFALWALVIEAVADLASLVVLGDLIYYYYPGHFWHITAIQNLPFYFITGILIAETIHWFKPSPHFFIVLSSWVVLVTAYL